VHRREADRFAQGIQHQVINVKLEHDDLVRISREGDSPRRIEDYMRYLADRFGGDIVK